MEAKEKAKLLVQSFKETIWQNGNPNHIDAHAKDCAILAVGEILQVKLFAKTDGVRDRDFWEQVKEEIEKL